MRHGGDAELTPVDPDATAIFFGASYHADYATVLVAPADRPGAVRRRRRVSGRSGVGRLGRRRPAPPALRRPVRRGAGRRVRGARDRERLDAQRRARGRLPGRDAARSASTWTGSSRPSARRSATRSGARSAGRPPSARSGSTTPPIRSRTSRRSSTCTRSAGGRPGCSRRRSAATRAGRCSGGCSSCGATTGPIRLTFLTVGGRRIAAGIHFETAGRLPLLQRRRRSRCTRPVARRRHGPRLCRARPRPGQAPPRLPPRRRTLQVRVGRGRRAHPARAGST